VREKKVIIAIAIVGDLMVINTLAGCGAIDFELDKNTKVTSTDKNRTDYVQEQQDEDINYADGIILEPDQIIEAEGYIDSEEICYRILISRKKSVEGEYDHVKDIFFVEKDNDVISLEVEYPSKLEAMDSDRYVFDACDFEAEFIDVTFDGNEDIVISLGHAGSHGDIVHCAYVYEDSKYVYISSFEEIANYRINEDEKCIESVVGEEVTKYAYINERFVSES
jgi:hypothetical protein